MGRYWLVAGAMALTLLALFGVVQALGVPLLSDPEPWLRDGGARAAAVGVGLLVVDVLLPVPSSLVMVAHGHLFGVLLGTVLSLVGSVGAAAVAFGLGRGGRPRRARVASESERAHADALLARWGGVAIVATRPIPVLAETVAALAGASPLRWATLWVAATLGNLVPALLYAFTGATSARLDQGFALFGLVVLVTGLFWFAARRVAGASKTT